MVVAVVALEVAAVHTAALALLPRMDVVVAMALLLICHAAGMFDNTGTYIIYADALIDIVVATEVEDAATTHTEPTLPARYTL